MKAFYEAFGIPANGEKLAPAEYRQILANASDLMLQVQSLQARGFKVEIVDLETNIDLESNYELQITECPDPRRDAYDDWADLTDYFPTSDGGDWTEYFKQLDAWEKEFREACKEREDNKAIQDAWNKNHKQ